MPHPLAPVAGNPWLLSADELSALAAGREAELSTLRELLLGERVPRILLTGGPGSGRSFLLARLARGLPGDAELAERHAPLVLGPLDFLAGAEGVGEAALSALAALERGRGNDARAASLAGGGPGEAWGLLARWTNLEGRGLLLVVDDLDRGLEALDDGGRALERALDLLPDAVLVGAARDLDGCAGMGAEAREIALEPLGDPAARELLSRLAAPRGAAGALEVLADPGRSRALLSLAAGNPASLVQLFEVLALGAVDDLGAIAERWLDRASPSYALRLGGLAHQAQRVAVGLARRGDPCTAAELSSAINLDVNAVSSQLSRLGRLGAITRVDVPDSGRTGFLLADRRFDLWLRCRVSAEGRAELVERVQFLALLNGAEAGETRLGRRVPAPWAIDERPRLVEWGTLKRAFDAAPAELPALDLRGEPERVPENAARWGRLGDHRRNALRHHVEAEDAYHTALGLDRSLGWVWNNLGNLLRVTFLRPDAAESSYRGALSVSPELPEAWVNLGTLLGAELGRPEEGVAAIRRGLALDATRAEAWAALAELLARLGLGRDAAAALEEALARDPSDPVLWRALAGLREEHGPASAVEPAWREAVRRGPSDADASTGLGLMLARRGMATAAERALRRAVAQRARSPLAWRALGELLAASVSRLGEAESALRRAHECSAVGAEEMASELALAWFLLATGRAPEEAEARAAELARRTEALGPIAVLVGARLARDAWDDALPLLRRVLGQGPWTDTTFQVALGWLVEAARLERAADAAWLIEEAGLASAWRPLHEALMAAAGDARRLERLSPELRAIATHLLQRARPEAPARAAPGATRRGRRPKRSW